MGRSVRRHQGVREDLITDRGRPDDGDDPHGATTLVADQRVDLDDRPQEPRPLASGLRGRQRKKAENHAHAVSLYFIFYNFCRSHQTLSGLSGCQRPCGHDRHRRTHVAGLGLTPHAARAGDVPAVVGRG